MRIFTVATLVTLFAGSASAHGDHAGGAGASLSHLLSDPVHVSWIVLAVVVAYGASRLLRRFSN